MNLDNIIRKILVQFIIRAKTYRILKLFIKKSLMVGINLIFLIYESPAINIDP